MSFIDDAKTRLAKAWSETSDEDRVVTVISGLMISVGALLLFLGILYLLFQIAKALFVPALIAVALYSAGVKWMGWPIPKFVKKFFK